MKIDKNGNWILLDCEIQFSLWADLEFLKSVKIYRKKENDIGFIADNVIYYHAELCSILIGLIAEESRCDIFQLLK